MLLDATRTRGVGGTAHAWNTPLWEGDGPLRPGKARAGAKYVPLDPWDFERRARPDLEGWPLEVSRLSPYYRRAQRLCGLRPLSYGADKVYVAGASVFPAAGFANPTLTVVALAARTADHLSERSQPMGSAASNAGDRAPVA